VNGSRRGKDFAKRVLNKVDNSEARSVIREAERLEEGN
jgi:hypothetical protein